MPIYLELFLSFMKIGVLSVGGGYAAIPFIREQAVEVHGWISMSEFADLITISEMTPGPIAVNSATFVGIRAAGFLGGIVCTLGCITPSLVIVLVLAKLYFKYRSLSIIQGALDGLRPAVVAFIASAGISIFLTAVEKTEGAGINVMSVVLFGAALIAIRKFKAPPIITMLLCGVISAAAFLLCG